SVPATSTPTSATATATVSTTSTQISTSTNQNSLTITRHPLSGRPSAGVTSIATHPADSSVVLAATPGGGVFRTLDGGTTWSPANGGLSGVFVRGVAIHRTSPNNVYLATDNGTWVSLDGGS